MSDELDPMEGYEEGIDIHDYDIMELFESLSFKEKWSRVAEGIKMEKDSGEYKWAKLQVMRLSGPLAAIIVPMLFMGILVLFASMTPPPPPIVEVTIVEPEPVEELEDIEPIEPEEIEPPEPMEEMEDFADVNIDNPNPSPPTDFSPQPAEFDAVAMVKSPVVMKGIYGSRSPGARGAAMAGYGGSGAGEACVLRVLRWFKVNQKSDGSWDGTTGGIGNKGKNDAAHTSVALLMYLAHGETPASEEFGPTVEGAIKFLVNAQVADGTFATKDGNNYTQPIVAYALSEAFALTKVPVLREAAEKAIQVVIDGQHPTGGWDYKMKQSDRDDTSVMGWCAQSLKAAKMAGLYNEGLKEAYDLAPEGFRKNYKAGNDGSTGGFGYTGPSDKHALTGVGVLCMQLLGQAHAQEVKAGLMGIKKREIVSWEAPQGEIYHWYYDTQAMFHHGGDMWNAWNKMFAPEMVKNQKVIKGKYTWKGKDRDIGYWTAPHDEEKHCSNVFNSALCGLSLQVYYRYLPTFKPPEKGAAAAEVVADDDIEIEIDI